jgi:hypothetical protein
MDETPALPQSLEGGDRITGVPLIWKYGEDERAAGRSADAAALKAGARSPRWMRAAAQVKTSQLSGCIPMNATISPLWSAS